MTKIIFIYLFLEDSAQVTDDFSQFEFLVHLTEFFVVLGIAVSVFSFKKIEKKNRIRREQDKKP